MTMFIDGQLSIFDVLDTTPAKPLRTNNQRDRNPVNYSHKHFVPSPECPVYCVMCGKKQIHYFDYSNNHHPMGWLAGQRMCTAMNLTMNHVIFAAREIQKSLAGVPVFQCCWDKHGLHGKAVRKPSIMQLADHLRWQIDHTRNTWGVRADLFDEWLGAYLLDYGMLRYSLDPAEYPEEFEGVV